MTLFQVADFETTTLETDCRIWAWGVVDVFDCDNTFEYGNSIQSFIDRISLANSVTYFHNLAFDGAFILDYLLRSGYVHVEGKRKVLNPKQFSTVISRSAQFYSITVVWETGRKTEFRDSLKKLPMSVSRVAKSFKLPESKLAIDYKAVRNVGHVLTEVEVAYLRADLVIVARALRIQLEQGLVRLTVGSDALAEYKALRGGAKSFERLFPVLSHEMDAEIRRDYRGGWTYADSRFRGRLIQGEGRVYDVNSLYPFVMRSKLLPFGVPNFTYDEPVETEEYPLFITSITFTATLKPGHLPCIQIKGSRFFSGVEYQESITEPTDIVCTNVDLRLWQEHYDIDILSYNGSWLFKGIAGVFNDYIDKWMKVKQESEGGLRQIAKLQLNSLYGKFATNPDVTPKLPVMEGGVVQYRLGEAEERNPVYTAMGVFITAWARDVTIRAAQANYPTFLYADTDSLHLLIDHDPDTLDVDPARLGAWKREAIFSEAIYARAKCYTERTEEGLVTHIAGLPAEVAAQVTFADYLNGKVFWGKLLPKRVPGGIVLTTTSFTLKALIQQPGEVPATCAPTARTAPRATVRSAVPVGVPT